MKAVAVILGYGIFALCGYLYGHNVGANLPQVDQRAIEQAVFMAMMEK